MKKFIASSIAALVILSASNASACPMCKEANESNDRRPKAYMYSILFMLAVPPSIFTAFGVKFYRLSKQANAELESHNENVE